MAAGMKSISGDGDYQAEADLRTLIEAHKIKRDTVRHKAAMTKHAQLLSHLNGMQGGKDVKSKNAKGADSSPHDQGYGKGAKDMSKDKRLAIDTGRTGQKWTARKD